jgi:hypothetical protein
MTDHHYSIIRPKSTDPELLGPSPCNAVLHIPTKTMQARGDDVTTWVVNNDRHETLVVQRSAHKL